MVGLDDDLVRRVKVRDPCIADHFAVHCELHLQKPRFGKKVVKFCKLRSIDIDSFYEDLRDSDLLQKSYSHLNTLVEQYDHTLLSILEKHAPEIQRQITVRPSAPWYTQEVADEKHIRRRLERKWRKSKTQSDRERYVHQCYVVNNLICNLKTTYYREIISENSGNQKVVFNTVNKLLQMSCVKRYPPSSDACSLANAFADFFAQKIDRIHAGLHEKRRTADPNVSSSESTRCQVELSDFAVLSQDTVKEYACKSAKKSCNLDPLPASLMKNCLDMLLPTITNIVNLSLSTGTMPETLKVAELVPALKKHDADHEQFSNFRPISNLVMVSKVIEKAVSVQLTDHVRTHHLEEWFQSAYKIHHSTETALVKVHNDILSSVIMYYNKCKHSLAVIQTTINIFSPALSPTISSTHY